ncbi:D-Ala-D-Ala carboxypeptidase family metallohydrolase [Enterobacter bugandensis]
MGDISPHFNRSEFGCKCGCGFNAVDKQLNEILEDVRTHFNAPLIINCACRCPAHNKAVGGEDKSQHLYGMAADITVNGYSPDSVANYLEQHHSNCGIGRYDTFTHIDVRGYAAHWDYRS